MKQIVIELSENDYELACKYHDYELVCRYPDALIAIYTHAIKNGTSLPKGKWERVVDKANHWVWECDKCSWQQRFVTNYCPDCGADMRGDADDNKRKSNLSTMR